MYAHELVRQHKLYAYIALARMDKPVGYALLLWPTLTALWLAFEGTPPVLWLGVYGLGVILMRQAGCIMNDLADHNFDGAVQRTQHRPLVTQALTRSQAFYFLGLHLLCAAGLLALCPLHTWPWGFLALSLAILYPFTKRFFAIPQFFLGLAFSAGIPMAFSTAQNTVPYIAWILVASTLVYALAYDAWYAMVDAPDDEKLSIHSVALLFKQHTPRFIQGMQILMLLGYAEIGRTAHFSWPYWSFWGLTIGLIIFQHLRYKKEYFKAFLHCQWLSFSLFLGTLLQYSLYPMH